MRLPMKPIHPVIPFKELGEGLVYMLEKEIMHSYPNYRIKLAKVDASEIRNAVALSNGVAFVEKDLTPVIPFANATLQPGEPAVKEAFDYENCD